MSFALECKKVKRTGFVPAFAAVGILGAAVPVVNMAVRSEMFVNLPEPPVKILLDANWDVAAMLNILIISAGACMMYHTEYENNAAEKMCTLPTSEGGIFLGKFALTAVMCAVMLAIQAAGVAFCVYHWFGPISSIGGKLLKSFGSYLLLTLPSVLLALLTASAFRNMWISLGICVICVFIATMIPHGNFALSLFPFALPLTAYSDLAGRYEIAALIEMAVISIAEMVFLKVRRSVR